MNARLKEVLDRAEKWPEERQRELAEIAAEIDREVAEGVYYPTVDELRAIEEGLAAIERGDIATDEQVRAVFAKNRHR
jgi:predicted transcriptional regulator